MATEPVMSLRGVAVHAGFLGPARQKALAEEVARVIRAAPLHSYETPGARRMSVRMTAAGQCGWVSERSGYRYAARAPSGAPWPPIPAAALAVWRAVAGVERAPDSCLINFYGKGARMGMHQDRDEVEHRWPVVSISLGDEALFRVGNTTRGGRSESLWLRSGDVLVLAGPSRLVYHGVDRIRFGSSTLLAGGGRLNLTLRVAGRVAGGSHV